MKDFNSKKMDITLVRVNNRQKLYQELSRDFIGIEPPFWLLLLAAFLREQGFSVSVVDADVENLTLSQTVKRIETNNPTLCSLVVSGIDPAASTTSMVGCSALLKELKKKNKTILTALTGLHPSALPKETLSEELVDFVVEGEGFITFSQLLNILKTRKFKDKLTEVDGLWYRKGRDILSNKRAKNIDDLGALPMSAWDLVPVAFYRSHHWHCFESLDKRQPYATVYTSLGCPFHCGFCNINTIFGASGMRYRPPNKVAEEIDFLVTRFGVRNIKIVDEMFALKPSHVIEVCEAIKKLRHDLNIWVYGRIELAQEKLLKKMRQAGVRWVAYGIESGSQKIRSSVLKSPLTKKDISRVVKMTQRIGIHVAGNFIFGLLEDDFHTMKETLDFAKGLNCDFVNFRCAMAYPGSPLYAQAQREKQFLPKNWSGYAQLSADAQPLSTKSLSGKQVLCFRDQAFESFFRQANYLDRIKKKFGPKAYKNIIAMRRLKVKRFYEGCKKPCTLS